MYLSFSTCSFQLSAMLSPILLKFFRLRIFTTPTALFVGGLRNNFVWGCIYPYTLSPMAPAFFRCPPPGCPCVPGTGHHTPRSTGGHIHSASLRLINECRGYKYSINIH